MRFLFAVLITLTSSPTWADYVDLERYLPAYDIMDLARRPVEHHVTFQESDFETKPWMKEFEWVIVINKATTGDDRQSLRIYRNQVLVEAPTIEAEVRTYGNVDKWHLKDLYQRLWSFTSYKVSTGREEFEPRGQNGAQRDNYTITPSGYFVSQYFTRLHKSEAYSNKNCDGKPRYVTEERIEGRFPFQRRVRYTRVIQPEKCIYMEDVVFFNGGIAIHKAISGTEYNLGKKASGGCVRLPGAVSAYLYRNLQSAKSPLDLPLVNQDGTVVTDNHGQIVRASKNKSIWGQLDARSALFIVHSTHFEKPVPIPTPRPHYEVPVPIPTPRPNIEAGE